MLLKGVLEAILGLKLNRLNDVESFRVIFDDDSYWVRFSFQL